MTGDYHGLPTRIISNQHLRLEFLAEAGPRIVRLMLAGSGQSVTHVETWELHGGLGAPQTTQDAVHIIHQMEDT